MMKCTLAFLFAIFLQSGTTAFAFTVAASSAKPIPTAETNIFVIGQGKDMGSQFVEGALSTYYRIREVFPQRQFLFLLQADGPEEVALLTHAGLTVLHSDSTPLLGASVIDTIRDFRQIASLELFSHGHAVYGAALSGNEPEQRFFQGTPGLETLKGAFTKFGYVHFHGCNAGFVTAPQVSKLLQVPVAGHLTGSNFEQPFSDGHWYYNDKGFYPTNATFAKANSLSYASPIACSLGACSRLVADPIPYNGSFGRHEVGLGFQKFYCSYAHGDECFGAMAMQLLSFPAETRIDRSSTRPQFDAVVRDLLCPSDQTREKRLACLKAIDDHLASGNPVLSFFKGKEPVCDLSGCQIKASCQVRQCVITPSVTGEPKNLLQEYHNYLQGFAVLNKGE